MHVDGPSQKSNSASRTSRSKVMPSNIEEMPKANQIIHKRLSYGHARKAKADDKVNEDIKSIVGKTNLLYRDKLVVGKNKSVKVFGGIREDTQEKLNST